MRKLLPTFWVMVLLAAGATVSAQVSIGVQIGAPPPPRAYKVPPQTNPDHEWVEGYWEPHGSKYQWRNGHWAQPPRRGAYWEQPYYSNGRYYKGSWQGGETTKGKGERGRPEPNTGPGGRDGR
jgi:hypothetical protein